MIAKRPALISTLFFSPEDGIEHLATKVGPSTNHAEEVST